jgi:hypothetical protein
MWLKQSILLGNYNLTESVLRAIVLKPPNAPMLGGAEAYQRGSKRIF